MMKKMRQKGALFVEYALILAFVLLTGVAFVNRNELPDSVKSVFVKAEQILGFAAGENKENGQGGTNTGDNGSGENQGSTGDKEDNKDNNQGENKEDNKDNNENTQEQGNSGNIIACDFGNIGRDGKYWSSDSKNYSETNKKEGFSTQNLVALDAGVYEIVFDRKAFENTITEKIGDKKWYEALDVRNYDKVTPYLMGYTQNEGNMNLVLDSKNTVNNPNYVTQAQPVYNSKNDTYTYTLTNSGETMNLGINFDKDSQINLSRVDSATLGKAINQSVTIKKIE